MKISRQYSADRSSELSESPATLVELLRWRAIEQPHQRAYTFLVDGETAENTITYEALDRQARAIAAQLQSLGASGARALLLYPPGLDYIAAFFGCLYAGCIAVPAYPPNPARLDRTLPRLRAIVQDAQPLAVLTTAPILAIAEHLATHDPAFQGIRWLATDCLDGELAGHWQAPLVQSTTLAFLQYTSGSTALPKGVMVSHGNLLHNQRMIQQAFGHDQRTVVVGWLPMYHDMGLIGNVLQPLYLGIPCILLSPADFLQSPLRWLQAISRYQATSSGGPNFAYDLCVRKVRPEQRATLDLRSWKVAFNGAEPIRRETLERFVETFGPCGFRPQAFFPCYGLAEATLFVSGGPQSAPAAILAVKGSSLKQNQVIQATDTDPEARMLVGSGQVQPDQHIAIVDPTTLTLCSPTGVGEIWVSGPSVAQGYWNHPAETAQFFQASLAGGSADAFLRTGDLGFIHNQELFVTGRLKDMLIIRGRNHYPHDIELTVEQSHAALRPGCGAACMVEIDGEERLVIAQEVDRKYRDLDVDMVAGTIRQAVVEQHGLQVYAVVLLRTGSIPKTSSGKIQRHACRAAFMEGSLEVLGISSMSESDIQADSPPLSRALLLSVDDDERQLLIESYLRDQVAQVIELPRSRVTADYPLSAFGLDSLMALDLKNRIEHDLEVPIAVTTFLEDLTIGQCTEQILAQCTHASAPMASITRFQPSAAEHPLSPEQQRLWFLDQLSPATAAYHVPIAYRLGGSLDVTMLERSFHELLRRHEALRATFLMQGGQPVQRIAPSLMIAPSVLDLSLLAEDERETAAQRIIEAEIARPFDLARGPLLRIVLLKLEEQEHLLLVVAHHIVCDLWSMRLLMREVAEFYRAFAAGNPSPFPELPVQYTDFVRWQRQWLECEATAAHLAYWREQLAHAPALELPTDRTRPATQSFRGAQRFFELSPQQCEAIRRLSRGESATLFMALLSAFTVVLQHSTSQDDLLVGTPISGRVRSELAQAIGFFAYPIALRIDLSGNPTFRELLARVRRVTLDGYAHQDVPFARVVEVAQPKRHAQAAPLFRVMFSLLDQPVAMLDDPSLTFQPVAVGRGATDFDLFLTISRGTAELRGVLEYNTDLFDASTIDMLIDSYYGVLEQAIQSVQTPLSDFRLCEALPPRSDPARLAPPAQTIALTATFTAEPIEETLSFWMHTLDIPSRIRFAPYNQVFQQLLDPTSLLAQTTSGINVILIRLEDWSRSASGERQRAVAETRGQEAIERNIHDLVCALKTATEHSSVPHLVCVCPSSPAAAADLSSLEDMLADALDGMLNVSVIRPSDLAAHYRVVEYYDAHADELGNIPFTPLFYAALGTMIARAIRVIRSTPYKVIALDCDNTLWSGICGEDGPLGIAIDPARTTLQEFMVAQHDSGMLLCLCSKNNEADVLEVFERRTDMPLKREHLISWRINWGSKAQNLIDLADELQLGLDSVIFIDDDPLICAEVQACCPEILTLQLPSDGSAILPFLRHTWVFDRRQATAEDRRRTVLYQQQRERERFRKQSFSLADFLTGLGLEVRIAPPRPDQLARAAQLTQRTNQFNLTTIRRSEAEIQALYQAGQFECRIVEVRDRFGDYGLVGLMIFEARPGTLCVDTFLLSCRALGRGVEYRMLAAVGAIARERAIAQVDMPYRPSGKNQPALDFLEQAGAAFKQPHDDGWVYRLPAEIAAGLTYSLPDTAPADTASADRSDNSPASPSALRRASTDPTVLGRIAVELSSAEHILEAVRAYKRADMQRAHVTDEEDSQTYVAPRTPLEEIVAALLAGVLGRDRVGVHDDFFKLGGHSILATQVVAQLSDIFQSEFPLRIFFTTEAFTAAEVAGAIERYQIEQGDERAIDALLDELNELSDQEVRELLAKEAAEVSMDA